MADSYSCSVRISRYSTAQGRDTRVGDSEALGGAAVHTGQRCVAYIAAHDEAEALDDVKWLLGHLPQNNLADAPRIAATDPADWMDPELDAIIPEKRSRPYDMRDVIRRIVDDGGLLEIQPRWAGNILNEFAHLGGQPVGIGLLGGAASPGAEEPTPEAPDLAAVRAQRQPLIDGVAVAVQLVVSVDGHGELREADDAVTRLILEAGRAGEGGPVVRVVLLEGFRCEVELEPARIAALRARASKGRAASARSGLLPVQSIIPGKVVQVSVAAGDGVTAGQQLLVIEAMKMQNKLRSPRDGTIGRVSIATGDNIEVCDLLVVIT